MRILAIWWIALLAGCSGGCAGTSAEGKPALAHVGGAAVSQTTGADAGSGTTAAPGQPLQQIASADPDAPAQWLGAAPLSHTMLRDAGGKTHLGIWVEVPKDAAADAPRPPMALALAIDASGSMSGAKIRHARMAASRLVESLSGGDVVAIFTFEDGVRQIAPATEITGGASREELLRTISQVRAGGSTNMYGGISRGQRALRDVPLSSHPVRRVLVISDGLANVGPSAPRDFAKLASAGAESQIQVSAIGVGLNYSEQTLGALAMHSEGRMYHLEHPEQLASILDSELNLLSQTVALNATIEISPAADVVLEGLEVGRAEHQGRRLRIPLGTLYAGQERELLVRARVLTQTTDDARALATVRLTYDVAGKARSDEQQVALRYALSGDTEAIEASYDPRVESLLASYRAAEKQEHAVELLNRGDSQQAAAVLGEAEEDLAIAVQKAPKRKKARLQEARRSVGKRKGKAAASRSRTESRATALETYDDAMGLRGF